MDTSVLLSGNVVRIYASLKYTPPYPQIRAMEPKNRIRVAQISPGFVQTEFLDVVFDHDKDKADKVLASVGRVLAADDVAEAVEYVLQSPPHVQVHDILLRPTAQSS